tara:strand:+ start:1825 stop:2613 length:789 start_codon:yes stop_codon:yes gene_type:complete
MVHTPSIVDECDSCQKKSPLIKHGATFLCYDCLKSAKGETLKNPTQGDKDYYFALKESIQNISEEQKFLNHLPEFYKLVSLMVFDSKSTWKVKLWGNAALAYLVMNKDVIADHIGPKGLIDDLFILSYILKKIRDEESKIIIIENLSKAGIDSEGEEFFNTIYGVYNECLEHIGKDRDKILNKVGLLSFDKQEKDKERKAGELHKRFYDWNNRKLKFLYYLTAMKVKNLLEEAKSHPSYERTKDYVLKHPEYGEIKRYMEHL